jgi:hypothetical protein
LADELRAVAAYSEDSSTPCKGNITMPSVNNVTLDVTIDQPTNEMTLVVNCDVEFTDVEVNAMNVLGLRYTLACAVYDDELLNERPVLAFGNQRFPRIEGLGTYHAHARFALSLPKDALRGRVGREDLFARVTLTNDETGAETVGAESEHISVDLAA